MLPDNRITAERMLKATKKKLAKNPHHAEAYDHQIREMVERRFSRKRSDEKAESYTGPMHYTSHNAIVRPEKKSTSIRIKFNLYVSGGHYIASGLRAQIFSTVCS